MPQILQYVIKKHLRYFDPVAGHFKNIANNYDYSWVAYNNSFLNIPKNLCEDVFECQNIMKQLTYLARIAVSY